MGFNLYFAGSRQPNLEEYLISKKCNRLFSQANERKPIAEYAKLPKDIKPKLFIDSGAFSVAHTGKQVDVDDYISYINQNDYFVDVWAQLDSIPFPTLNATTARQCSEESWKNYLYMVDKIPTPEKLLPLYHFGEPKENLKRILNTPIDILGNVPAPYIGVGGRHGVTTQEQLYYFDDVFNIVAKSDNPNVKIHAFGMTVLDLLEQFPFYSADSTSYLKFAIYGMIVTKHGGIVVSSRSNSDPKNLFSYSKEAQKPILETIEKLGYTLEELSEDYNARLRFNVDYFKDWADNYVYKPNLIKRKRLI